MTVYSFVRNLVCVALAWGLASSAEAQDGGLPPTLAGFGQAITQQLSSNAADFPAISTVPGLTFRYDSQTQLFERSSSALGPVFVERARTVGRGKVELGVSYIFIDFDELDGQDVEDFGGPGQNDPNVILDIEKFNLESHIVSFFSTYGITDRWDVNLLLPLIVTSFDSRVSIQLPQLGPAAIRFAESSDNTGIGDLFLRTKYHVLDYEGFGLALGSTLRFPTGDEDDLQGKGDYILEPFFALEREYQRFDFHLSSGIEINFDDSDRSRVRYAGGVSIDIIEQFALLVDVIGSSSLKTDRITGPVPGGGAPPPPGAPGVPSSFSTKLQTDIVDLALGFKVNIGPLTGFATFFVPITDDGLRADWIPAGGLQYSF